MPKANRQKKIDRVEKTNKEKTIMNDKYHKKISVELTSKEINTLIFQLQERIEHYQLQEKYGVSTAYLENIQDKLMVAKQGEK
jgi:galactose-1-phosphate uridylyltransferase